MNNHLDPLPQTQPGDIFDRRRIRLRRAAMARRGGGEPFLAACIADRVCERLADVKRTWTRALIIGAHSELAAMLRAQAVTVDIVDPGHCADPSVMQCDMDRILSATGPFDLILWPGGLESTNDVPGALAQCRALLVPDGLLIGAFCGAGSLPALRHAIKCADTDATVARFHPQIDVRAMGDLLQRTGFALPTIDVEPISLRYAGVTGLVRDLRGSGLTRV